MRCARPPPERGFNFEKFLELANRHASSSLENCLLHVGIPATKEQSKAISALKLGLTPKMILRTNPPPPPKKKKNFETTDSRQSPEYVYVALQGDSCLALQSCCPSILFKTFNTLREEEGRHCKSDHFPRLSTIQGFLFRGSSLLRTETSLIEPEIKILDEAKLVKRGHVQKAMGHKVPLRTTRFFLPIASRLPF